MKYKNFWDIYMEYLPDYIFTDNITDLINFIKEKDYYVADIEVKDSYSLNDDATSNLDMIFLEDNLSVKYTDETHPIIIYPYSTFPVVVFPDFFNKYKDLLLKIKTEQDIEKIQGKKNARRKVESTITINEKFNNLVDIIDYIDDDCNCLIRIENIKLDDVILKKLRSKKINIEYFDENDKKTIISSKYAILYYTYESLKEYKKIIIDETITARDISNLLLVPDDTIIEWKFSGDSIIKSEDYNSIEKALDYMTIQCNTPQMRRFISVVLQNMKRGGTDVIAALQDIGREQWEERKAAAKRLCAEADSKLLFPMMLMLFSVVLMTVTPALSQASAKASATSRLILKPLVMYPAFFWYFSVAIVCALGLPLGIFRIFEIHEERLQTFYSSQYQKEHCQKLYCLFHNVSSQK